MNAPHIHGERARLWAKLHQFDNATRHYAIFSSDSLWKQPIEHLATHDRAIDALYRERLDNQPAELRAHTEYEYYDVLVQQMTEYDRELARLEGQSAAERVQSRPYERAIRIAFCRRMQTLTRHELLILERKRGTTAFDAGLWEQSWRELCKLEGILANAATPAACGLLYHDWRHWHERLLLRIEERVGSRPDARTKQQMIGIRQHIAALSPAPRLRPALITATVSFALMVGFVILLFIQAIPVLGQEQATERSQRRPTVAPSAEPRRTATPPLSGTARRVTPTPTSGLAGVAQAITPTATPPLTGKAAPRARVPSPTPLRGRAAPVR